jgi:exonuclease III
MNNTNTQLLLQQTTPPLIHPPSQNNSSNTTRNLISISTINARGLNNPSKLYSLIHGLKNNRAVICCTETKNNQLFPIKNRVSGTTIISSLPATSAKNGASIILGKDLTKHLFQKFSINEYWTSAHLKFRPKIDIIITSVYLPHNNKERKEAVLSLRQHLNKFPTANFHHILAGDFNSYPHNSPSINAPTTTSKRLIYSFLNQWIDIAEATDNLRKFTHLTQSSASRIDQIWTTKNLASRILDYQVTQSNDIITDHKLVQVIFDWFEWKPSQHRYRPIQFDTNKATPKALESFTQDVELKCLLPLRSWKEFNIIITSSLINNLESEKETKRLSSEPPHIASINKTIKNIKSSLKKFKNNESFKLNKTANEWNQTLNNGLYSTKGLQKLFKLAIKEKMAKVNTLFNEQLHSIISENISRFWCRPKPFIKKALGNLKPSLDLNILKDQNNELTDDPEQIKNLILNHFIQILKPTHLSKEEFCKWQSQYAPGEKWDTKSCMQPISLTELNEIIHNSPLKKTPGESGITYEIIKTLGPIARSYLCDLFNTTLQSTEIPAHWRKSKLVLLPKRTIWTHNLNDTRPISLIETSRKVFTKILNDRLSNALSSNNILSQANFAGQKNQSVMEPLTIASSLLEQAINNDEELWFASFDISKAFDSVNLESLHKAMQRINVPPNYRKIIMNLLRKRSIQINTNHGFTETATISKGLDQGETLSPLLWTIFYDPLVSKIDSRSKNNNILAYMDDLALIDKNFQSLQENTNTLCSFLKLNAITCNSEKTNLICTLKQKNQKRHSTLSVNNSAILPVTYPKSLKYLGCYLSGSPHNKDNHNNLTLTITNTSKAIIAQKNWNSQMTKQVLEWTTHPHLAYFNYTSYLTPLKLTRSQSTINRTIKHATRMSLTSSNKIAFSQIGLNIKKLSDTQELTMAKLLVNRLNNSKTKAVTTSLIQSIQAAHAIWLCPICQPSYFKNSWITTAAKALKKYEIRLCPPNCPFTLNNSELSIGLLNTSHISKKTAKFLLIHNFKTLADILVYNSTRKLTWKELHTRTTKQIKGRCPKWYKLIQPTSNLKGQNKATPNLKATFWATVVNQQIIYVKTRKKKYIRHIPTKGKHFLLNHDKSISICTGCSLGNFSNDRCNVPIDPFHTISLWTYRSQNTTFINNPLEEIMQELPKTHAPTNHPHITIYPPSKCQTLLNPHLLDDLMQICKIQALDSITIKRNQNAISFESKKSKLSLVTSQNPISSTIQVLIGALHSAPTNSLITINSPFKISLKPIVYINHEIKCDHGNLINELSDITSKKQIKIKTIINKNLKTPDEYDDSLQISNLLSPENYITTGRTRDKWIPCLVSWIKKLQYISNISKIFDSESFITNSGQPTVTRLLLLIKSNQKLTSRSKFSLCPTEGFKNKILEGKLPTRELLNKFFPNNYQTNTCPRCNSEPETQIHIFKCQANLPINGMVGEKIRSYILKKLPTRKSPSPLADNIRNYQFNNPILFKDIIIANLPPLLSTLSKKTQIKIVTFTTNLAYNEIWLPRCATANTSPSSGIKWSTPKPHQSKPQANPKKTPATPTAPNNSPASEKILDSYITTIVNQNFIFPPLATIAFNTR